MADIFLSYASEEQERVRPVHDLLLRRGWTVFWAEGIEGGTVWRDRILRELARAKCVVVLWTIASSAKKWVREEATEGQRRGVLVQCLIDVPEPPIGFREEQCVDLRDWLDHRRSAANDSRWRMVLEGIGSIVGNVSADREHALAIYKGLGLQDRADPALLREFASTFARAAPLEARLAGRRAKELDGEIEWSQASGRVALPQSAIPDKDIDSDGLNSFTLTPGEVDLADWRAIYLGAAVRLDAACTTAIEASAHAIEAIVARGEPVYGINTGFGKLANVLIAVPDLARLQRNIVLSHATGVGEPAPTTVVRLMLALKMASLAQGASGVSLGTVEMLEKMLARSVLPVVPGQGSVGASGDLAPLAHMAATMIGVGEASTPEGRMPADAALRRYGLKPLTLGPKEGLALLNGTQFSCANALAALFEVTNLFRTALVTGALSTEAAKGSDAPFDPRIHALRPHRGQVECARALRALMAGSAIRESHRVGDDRVQDPYCLRCQPQVMGAVLDVLQHAAATLAVEANCVSDNPLIVADSALSGGNFHAQHVAFAADIMALALCEIGSLAERRIAMLIDPAMSRLPPFLAPRPGLNSGFMLAQVTAAALAAENKQRAAPASIDSIPTSANQEDHVSMSAHAARRLLPMAENLTQILAIELLVGSQGCDFHTPLTSSDAIESVRSRLRAEVPALREDRYLADDIAKAADLVRGGHIVTAAVGVALP